MFSEVYSTKKQGGKKLLEAGKSDQLLNRSHRWIPYVNSSGG